MRKLTVGAALGIFLLLAPSAAAQPPSLMPSPHLRLSADSTLATPTGSYLLPMGAHILDEPSWWKLDAEVRRLQDAETRLAAENTSLRKGSDSWRPGWKTIAGTLLVGVSVGFYVGTR